MHRGYKVPQKYVPINPDKYVGSIRDIQLRSSWERKFAYYADTHPGILKWGSEIKAIPYYSRIDGKVRRYYVDFWILYKKKDESISRAMVEIKPYAQTIQPKQHSNKKRSLEEMQTWIRNQDKWQAAKEFGDKAGFEFIILTEKELGIR